MNHIFNVNIIASSDVICIVFSYSIGFFWWVFLILFVSIFITYHNLCYRACHQHIAACRIFIVKINKGDKDILGQI